MKDITAVIDSLNDAFERDPLAMRLLTVNLVSCNVDLANHPTIQVGSMEGGYTVSALGLINGVLGSLELPLIASQWSDDSDEEGRHQLLGFCEYHKQEP